MTTPPIVDRLISQLRAQGMGELKAKDVALLQLNKSGIIDEQGELTAYGRERQAMGPDGRAKDRAAKASNGRHKPGDYAYDRTTNRATLKAGAKKAGR